MTKQQYNEEQIKVLEGLEAVRKRPAMYIGSTSSKGLHHLVWEIIDNSIDEAMAGFGNEINVTIHQDNSISVRDYGRGIPVGIHKDKGIPTVEVVLTVLHAGGKFGGEGSAYKSSGGLHGVGSSCVNALSESMVATVRRDGEIHRIEFSRGETVKELTVIGTTDESDTGTLIWFKPDGQIFKETLTYDYDTIYKRLSQCAYLNAGLKITLTDERVVNSDQEFKNDVFLYENGILDYIKFLNEKKTPLHQNIIHLIDSEEDIRVEVGFQYTSDYKEQITSFTNNIRTYEGGSHETGFKTAITQTIKKIIEEKGLLKNPNETIDGADTRIGLVGVISVKVPEPEFEGQTKTKLGNSEVRPIVQKIVQEQFNKFLAENPQELKLILDKVMESYDERLRLKRARQEIRNQNKRESSSFMLPEKLADCRQSTPPEKSELYIVEGDSAGGTAKMGRFNVFQAVLPMKGKILNVEKAALNKILSNEEIRNIVDAIGTGMGDSFDITKARYHKIIVMTDADDDGAHIQILLLTLFYRFMRPLIDLGYIFLAQPPLYGIKRGSNILKFARNEEELAQAKKEFPNGFVQRYKGLGEMNATELRDTTMDPESRILIRVCSEDAELANEIFEELMGESPAKRKVFIEENSHTVELDV
ncbi:DNA gyrase/topoisomerase IV subunit B [Bacillus cereus]|uniref:DNA gyrase/topoisomerase IV subunit B n=1 Tax=Bacillus cereus TaxID=1396 RepID=UPI000B4B1263|nr:DNA topoisomerase subunit B [Bacillus cereus]